MPVSLCVLRLEVDEEKMSEANSEIPKEVEKKDRGARESKTITVETYASKVSGSQNQEGILPTSSRIAPSVDGNSNDDDSISFFCGNPLIEVTKGVLHLYKENELKEQTNATTLCLLAVPSSLGAKDLLAFAAACQQDIAHVRVLRDGSPSHYMALLTFRNLEAAEEFHGAFDGVPYSSLEPASLCHVAWVSRVEWGKDGTPPPAHTELPTCPVCLERMDESVAGVLSVQCSHAFHSDCLLRWGDDSCPVCRCTQTPEATDRPQCFQCSLEENSDGLAENTSLNVSGVAEGLMDDVDTSALWICLICGHVGCGRYEKGHAAKHFMQSNHTYALQLGSNRVWDYAGDNFVHRLVQNKGDGKLVAADGNENDGTDSKRNNEKWETARMDFAVLLTQQLESQRHYYEEIVNNLRKQCDEELSTIGARAESAEQKLTKLQKRETTLVKENKALHAKLNALNQKMSTIQKELSEEKGLTEAMSSNQAVWHDKVQECESQLKQEVDSLKEQLRDVMLFLEARDKLAEAAPGEDISTATVTLSQQKGGRRKRR